jgi:hypothetical protein
MSQKIITVALFIVVLVLSIGIVILRNENDPEIIPVIYEESSSETLTTSTSDSPKISRKVTTAIPQIYHIELNTADYKDFLQLGLTPELAVSCVELRGKISYFSNVLELLYADGMTTEIYREIDDYCYVDESFNPGVNYPDKG